MEYKIKFNKVLKMYLNGSCTVLKKDDKRSPPEEKSDLYISARDLCQATLNQKLPRSRKKFSNYLN